jgi:hypothetical protein
MRGRRLGGLVLGTLLATLVAWSPLAISPVLAAGPLRVAADTTYTVDPGAGRVHVAIRYTFTNNKPNTSTIIYYYRELSVGVQPGASSIRAVDGSGGLATSTARHTNFTRVDVRLRANLYYHRSATFTLRYDLVGGKPRSESPIRVTKAFVTFGVWAFGDRNLGTVEVRMPGHFASTIEGGPMATKTGASGNVLTASPTTPDEFFAIVTGENTTEYERELLALAGGVDIAVLSWPEDPTWSETVTDTLREGMPELQAAIGLDWPVDDRLDVRERYTPSLEGYAGLFFTDEQRIDVSEDLDPVTILHEASHAWFNDDLFSERWIYEGLAEEYAWRALADAGLGGGSLPAEPNVFDPGWQSLIGWKFPEAIREEDTEDEELYGYNASFWVVHQIVQAAGVPQMRAAFAAARRNLTAYPGAGAPETVAAGDDWRRFLDLVEPIDEPDRPEVDEAVSKYVVTTLEAQTFAVRSKARAKYRELLSAGDGWLPPWSVRSLMGTWSFTGATSAMDEAFAVLELRDQVDAAAQDLGLEPHGALEAAYEGADSFAGAKSLAEEELDALGAIADARARMQAEPDLFAQVGLLGGEAPSVPYQAARTAFEAGNLHGAIAQAGTAASIVTGAPARGQERVIMGAIVLVALVALLVFIVVLRRRRSRRAIGVEPGSAAFLALDARLAPDAAATPDAAETPDAAMPPEAHVAPEAVGPSGTLGADPDGPSSPPGGGPADREGGPTDT